MILPVTIFLGLKLSALTSSNRFVALTSRLAVIGIMLGVATLITVLSVMRGFEKEIRHSLIKEFDHLQVYSFNDRYPDSLYEELLAQENVVSVTGYAEAYGLIRVNKQYMPMLLLSFENSEMKEGLYLADPDVAFFSKSKDFTVIVPSADKMMPVVSTLPFVGEAKNKGLNTRSVMGVEVSYPVFQKVTGKKALTGLSVVVDDLYATSRLKAYLRDKYHGIFQAFDWKDKYQPLFSALKLQRTVMVFVLSMITLVAMFSLVSGLVMLSSDRLSEIALLRAMGLSRFQLKLLFLIQGGFIGLIGVVLGIMMGLLLCYYAQSIAVILESILGYSLIDERIYGVSTLPTQTDASLVLSIGLLGFLSSILAAIYPASRIAKQEPAEVLRYG